MSWRLWQVDGTGSVRIPWTTPDDIGEYVVRAYAVSGLNSYGQAESSIITRMPEGISFIIVAKVCKGCSDLYLLMAQLLCSIFATKAASHRTGR